MPEVSLSPSPSVEVEAKTQLLLKKGPPRYFRT